MTALALLVLAPQSLSGCLVEAVPPPAVEAVQSAVSTIGASDRFIAVGNVNSSNSDPQPGVCILYERGALDTEVSFSEVLTPPNNDEFTRFGFATATVDDLLVVCAPGPSTTVPMPPIRAAALVYRHDGTAWQLESTLESPRSQDGDRYATSVAVAKVDGVERIAIGAYGQVPEIPGVTSEEGAVFVFENAGSGWSLIDEVNPSRSDAPFHVGRRIVFDGRTLIASDQNSSGRGSDAYVFRYDETFGFWRQEAILPDTVGYDVDEDSLWIAAYDRFADRTDVLEAARDPDLGAWTASTTPLFSVETRALDLAADAGNLLLGFAPPPRFVLHAQDVSGAWAPVWRAQALETESSPFIQANMFGPLNFSRGQLVVAVSFSLFAPYAPVYVVDPTCQ
ncbi:MAG: hypothetical protein AAFQ53_05025, partial [Bacteroidota bacterium]